MITNVAAINSISHKKSYTDIDDINCTGNFNYLHQILTHIANGVDHRK
ncbi:hypothetical protein BN1221_02494c [Brenneria goodwinii]|uniref:Uncharacterized protein n=1 Tax=Brenneria goodwinii TaxID=1109412 RepID=A0A0G4JVY2_9GAMM|nr:hypothetical protein BN1221_02494c [Brenneria goodwinii]